MRRLTTILVFSRSATALRPGIELDANAMSQFAELEDAGRA